MSPRASIDDINLREGMGDLQIMKICATKHFRSVFAVFLDLRWKDLEKMCRIHLSYRCHLVLPRHLGLDVEKKAEMCSGVSNHGGRGGAENGRGRLGPGQRRFGKRFRRGGLVTGGGGEVVW